MGVDRVIDITAKQRKTVTALLERHLPGTAAWIYGSRAKWTARPQSDLDLVVFATSEQNGRIGALREAFEESDLPFRVDLFVWDEVPDEFRKQIQAEHVVLVAARSREPSDGRHSGVAGETTTNSTLDDYFTLQRGTTYRSRLLDEPGPVLLGLATIQRNGGFRTDSLRTYGGESPDKLLVQPGELYVSLKDVTQSADLLGAVARLPFDHPPGRLTQDTVKLTPRRADIPIDYLYWLLRTPEYRGYCRAHATGTTNLGLAREDFLAFQAPAPTPYQHRIADTLGTLDDKIELNRRMNETLEALARALFTSWFVKFDPVRAKMAGRDPSLPKHIADLFPARLVASDLGEIPEGWEASTIGQEVDVVGGSTPSTRDPSFWNGTINWATPKDLSSLESPVLVETSRRVTEKGLDKISSGLLPKGTVLLSSRAPIGYVAIADIPVAINQGFIAMKCRKRLSAVYVWLWTAANMDSILEHANGSTFQEISKSNFRPLHAIVPQESIRDAHDQLIQPLYNRIVKNERESRDLAALRDTLLPRLISGKMRVNDAEAVLDRAP